MKTTMKTFFHHGIPPLGSRSGSKSKGSVSKEKHEDASMIESTFGVFPDESLCHQDNSYLWLGYEINGKSNDWGSESDIQGLVKQVLQSAIYTVGLQSQVKCFNELSIFDLRPDIWRVCIGGSPIGVVEVKKPESGNGGTLQNTYVQGQIFDYMLRLKSFYGLDHVFGILSSYKEWRICWLPSSDGAAEATTTPVPGQEKKTKTVVPPRLLHGSRLTIKSVLGQEKKTKTVVPPRLLHGSRLFAWNDKTLPRVLCTTILKMYHSPRSPVQLVDKNRPYIIIDENQWHWGKIEVESEDDLHHSTLPSANKFTLLADLREGADGRVWRACTDAGLGCCIKFPIRSGNNEGSDAEQMAQIRDEAENWHKAYGEQSARVLRLAGRPALVMRYLRPVQLVNGNLTSEDEIAVDAAIKKFADKGLKHDDLSIRHLGILSPPKKKSRGAQTTAPTEVILFDLGRVSQEQDREIAVAEMMSQLNCENNLLKKAGGQDK